MSLRDDLKTLAKIEQHSHIYTPDQLRAALRLIIAMARDQINEAMLREGE